jgi:hypothetical protein
VCVLEWPRARAIPGDTVARTRAIRDRLTGHQRDTTASADWLMSLSIILFSTEPP